MRLIDITRPLSRAVSFVFAVVLVGVAFATPETLAQGPRGVIVAVDDVVDPVLLPAYEVEYVVAIDNFSEETLTNVAVTAETPAGTYFGEASTSVGTIEAPSQGARGPMVVRVGTLSPGGAVHIRFELGLEAPAGSRIDFVARVTSASGEEREIVEPTFVINRGEPVLKWEPQGGGPTTGPPRIVRIERPTEPLVRPNQFPVEPIYEGLEYRVYRSSDPNPTPSTSELVLTLPGTQRNTGALEAPGFYFVTAVYNGEELPASNVVSLGLGEPTIERVVVKDGVLKARGAGFDNDVEVMVDGLSFNQPATVKRGGTRVTQAGKLSNGRSLTRYLRGKSDALVCFHNANGSVACARYVQQ